MARETDDPEVSSYINNKVSQINWVIKCIENRNKTLLEVSKAIVKRQERFFPLRAAVSQYPADAGDRRDGRYA